MDDQKCRICGERHKLGPCPQPKSSGGGVEGHAVTPSRSADSDGQQARDGRAVKGAGIKPGPSETKFDRNSYQKEYMRKYRAKKRIPKNPIPEG